MTFACVVIKSFSFYRRDSCADNPTIKYEHVIILNSEISKRGLIIFVRHDRLQHEKRGLPSLRLRYDFVLENFRPWRGESTARTTNAVETLAKVTFYVTKQNVANYLNLNRASLGSYANARPIFRYEDISHRFLDTYIRKRVERLSTVFRRKVALIKTWKQSGVWYWWLTVFFCISINLFPWWSSESFLNTTMSPVDHNRTLNLLKARSTRRLRCTTIRLRVLQSTYG